MINMTDFNVGIKNISDSFQYSGYQNQQIIDIESVMREYGQQIPKSIMLLIIFGVTCILIYYYILPIWNKYFIGSPEMQENIFKAGLIFLIMAGIYLLFFGYDLPKYLYILYPTIYFIIFVIVYKGSKWLIKRSKKNEGL